MNVKEYMQKKKESAAGTKPLLAVRKPESE